MVHLTCNDALLQHIQANLENFPRRTTARRGLKRAAVAIVIVDLQEDPALYGIQYRESMAGHAAVIITRRAAALRKHAGQWALPGGRLDQGESPEAAVLRELEEEVGLRLGPDRVIGRLDDYNTRSGFSIAPVVVWGGPGITLNANPGEVAAIHRIPLAEFMRDDAPILEAIPESKNPVLMMPVGNSWIAAPTAALLYQFREVGMLGRHRRVAHFEAPYFAWR